MRLPEPLAAAVHAALAQSGDMNSISRVTMLPGGSINLAARIATSPDQVYFLKWHDDPPPHFFTREAAGLDALRVEGGPRIPEVLGAGEEPPFLLLEWVTTGEKRHPATTEALGEGLAKLHQRTADRYGLAEDNYIGELHQPNGWADRWVTFYAEKRLRPQLEMAHERGLLPPEREKRLHTLMERLGDFLDEDACAPSVLHGDLWGGNWLADADNRPVLIDPAMYHGHREVDLAMTALFGGFPRGFYKAYNRAYPLDAGYQKREPLYQLYYLLVHLVHFGESYGPRVDSILQHYVG